MKIADDLLKGNQAKTSSTPEPFNVNNTTSVPQHAKPKNKSKATKKSENTPNKTYAQILAKPVKSAKQRRDATSSDVTTPNLNHLNILVASVTQCNNTDKQHPTISRDGKRIYLSLVISKKT